MLRSIAGLGLVLSAAAVVFACGGSPEDDGTDGSGEALSNKNENGAALGAVKGEIMLTLDDGPGPRTAELADWLGKHEIPATFFMVGKNAAAHKATVQHVVDVSKAHNGILIIANHSMNHQAKPLPSLGTEVAIHEIMDADAVLKRSIADSQSVGYKSAPVSFFRPPYGALTALGPTNMARINAAGGAGYAGPIFWDIGGELKGGHSADWACWGKNGVDIPTCAAGYIAEAQLRGKGIMLAHDVHSRTIDMLTGNGKDSDSLILNLQKRGFKFVSMRKDDAAVATFVATQTTLSSSATATVGGTVAIVGDKVHVDITASGADRVSIAADGAAGKTYAIGQVVTDFDLAAGQHVVTVTAIDAAGNALAQEKFPVVVPAAIGATSQENTNPSNSACVKLDLLKAGSRFTIYHGRTACTGSNNSPVAGECYGLKGTMTATRDPQLVGPGDWSSEFKLTYETDKTDLSTASFLIDATTGEIDSGRRSNWTINGKPRQDATFESTAVDCKSGTWHGKIHYAGGQSEEYLYVRAD